MLNLELFPADDFSFSPQAEAAFRQQFHDLCTRPLPGRRQEQPLYYTHLPSPIGPMVGMASEKGVVLLEFHDMKTAITKEITDLRRRHGYRVEQAEHPHLEQLRQQMQAYFAGELHTFTVALDAPGSAFEETVWRHLLQIPYGVTCSYGDLAKRIGPPAHPRIVGAANGHNRISIIIPCHRVIGANGTLTGYGGGIHRKRWLLEFESLHAASARQNTNPTLQAPRKLDLP